MLIWFSHIIIMMIIIVLIMTFLISERAFFNLSDYLSPLPLPVCDCDCVCVCTRTRACVCVIMSVWEFLSLSQLQQSETTETSRSTGGNMPLGFVGLFSVILAGQLFLHSSTEELPADHLLQHLQLQPESSLLKPTVLISILARNAQHSLPYFLGCIERLDYPKERISLW